MNKRRLRARTLSLEVLHIMRQQELEQQSGKTIKIPDCVYERIKDAEKCIADEESIT